MVFGRKESFWEKNWDHATWTSQIFDMRMDFPVPAQSRIWIFFSHHPQNPLFAFELLHMKIILLMI